MFPTHVADSSTRLNRSNARRLGPSRARAGFPQRNGCPNWYCRPAWYSIGRLRGNGPESCITSESAESIWGGRSGRVASRLMAYLGINGFVGLGMASLNCSYFVSLPEAPSRWVQPLGPDRRRRPIRVGCSGEVPPEPNHREGIQSTIGQ